MPKKKIMTMLAEYRNGTGTYVGVKIATTDAVSYITFAMSVGDDDPTIEDVVVINGDAIRRIDRRE
jgi:hypothetical protein